jgi:hypothetical protein
MQSEKSSIRMVDRVEVLSVLPNRGSLPAVPEVEFHKLLDKAIAVALSELGLKDARKLPTQDRAGLEGALRHILTLADLKKVSRRWEPQRKIDDGTSENRIADALVELLHGRREPYEFCAITLAQARSLGARESDALRASIDRVAPVGDLRKLSKSWDKENKLLAASERKELASGLLALLGGKTEPMPPLKKAKAAKK